MVGRLDALITSPTALLGDGVRFGEARGREVRGADPTDFALLHQRVERLHDLVERRLLVVAVGLVQVDVVGLEALQRVLDGLDHVGAREALLPLAHRAAELGGDDHVLAVPPILHPLAEDQLGLPAAAQRE